MKMTKEEYEEAYKIASNLIDKLTGKHKELKEFTDKYLKIFVERKETSIYLQ